MKTFCSPVKSGIASWLNLELTAVQDGYQISQISEVQSLSWNHLPDQRPNGPTPFSQAAQVFVGAICIEQ